MSRARKPGPTLDARIAVEVFGWKQYRAAPYPPQSEQAAARCWHRPGIDAPCTLPMFSTDISDAWRIVEEMTKRGIYAMIEDQRQVVRKPAPTRLWSVILQTGIQTVGEGFGPTLPVAVCRAALDVNLAFHSASPVVASRRALALAVDPSWSTPNEDSVMPSRSSQGANER